MGVEPGTVVVLNGTASSGKTGIALALQDLMLPDAWWNAGIDRFLGMLPKRYLEWPMWSEVMGEFDRPGDVGRVFMSAMHRAMQAISLSGVNVVADHVIVEPAWVSELAGLFAAMPAWFVGIRLPLDVVVRRERDRGDRDLGEAEKQFPIVHERAAYDFELDTSEMTAQQAATEIRDRISAGRPRAFRLLAVFEGAPAFVRRLLATDSSDPLEVAEQVALAMPEEDQIELVNAHPRIGAIPSSVSAMSYSEQGYDRDRGTTELHSRLDRLNGEYERRFGFRFVIFVAGRPRSDIADILESSLSADREAEKRRALSHVVAIARDRAAKLTPTTWTSR